MTKPIEGHVHAAGNQNTNSALLFFFCGAYYCTIDINIFLSFLYASELY